MVVLSSYSTSFVEGQDDRNHNIRLAAEKLDGAVIPPGEAWSFNQHVGPRTLERGWRAAPTLTIEGRELGEGGGVCLVSSTVYNAMLLADLAILERSPHSRPIRYIPLGRDATVDYGVKDLRVRNRHAFPVRIAARVVGRRLVVEVLGRRPLGYDVQLETADSEPASPRKEIQVIDRTDDLAVAGVWVKLYRHRVKEGSVFETERIGAASYYPFKIKAATR